MKLKVLELFCGTKSLSNVAKEMGMEVFTSDVNKRFRPDYRVNILLFDVHRVPFKPDIIWASPPCTWFSVASAWKHWNKDYTPKTLHAQLAINIIERTLEVIRYFDPPVWYLENPRGILRKLGIMDGFLRHTVTYCSYGDQRFKPTDIWSNDGLWTPRAMAKVSDALHVPNGTVLLNTPAKRAVLPPILCGEILLSSAKNILTMKHFWKRKFFPALRIPKVLFSPAKQYLGSTPNPARKIPVDLSKQHNGNPIYRGGDNLLSFPSGQNNIRKAFTNQNHKTMKKKFKDRWIGKLLTNPNTKMLIKAIPFGIGSLAGRILDNTTSSVGDYPFPEIKESPPGSILNEDLVPELVKLVFYIVLVYLVYRGVISWEDAQEAKGFVG